VWTPACNGKLAIVAKRGYDFDVIVGEVMENRGLAWKKISTFVTIVIIRSKK